MSTPALPPKESVTAEILSVARTLSNAMQKAAVKKARELGFDLTKGRLSLEETLINLAHNRDVLIDAAEKGKLTQLPLKLQYSLFGQTQKIAETLGSLVNGTDAVQNLEEVVDELTATIWQYNLHNLSEQVLGFQEKMNQLKNQEVLIRQVHREAEAFETTNARAAELLQSIESTAATSTERAREMQASIEQVATILAKVAESEQRAAALSTQIEQRDSVSAQHEANTKNAAASAQSIEQLLPPIHADIQTAKNTLADLTSRTSALLSQFESSSQTALRTYKLQYQQLTETTESQTKRLHEELAKALQETSQKLTETQSEALSNLNTHIQAVNKKSDQAVQKFEDDSKSALNDETAKFEASRVAAEKEQQELVVELGKLEDQIRDSIRRATGYGLFSSFQTRQQELVAEKRFWSRTLAAVVGVSILFSLLLIWDLSSRITTPDYGPIFFLKLSISLPLIYAITFCSVQYSRERRLEEEYAFKSTISISLDPYRELVEKLVVKDVPEERAKYTAFVIESVGRVFTSPMERIFDDHSKEPKSVDGTIKAVRALLSDVLKAIGR